MNISDYLSTNTYNPYQSLFGSTGNGMSSAGLFGQSSNSSSMGIFGSINLSNYASIKSGSYYKALKTYYSDTVDPNSEQAKAAALVVKNKLDSLSDHSSKLSGTLDSLMDADYSKEESREKITSDLKDFVSEYNKMIDSAYNSDNKYVLQKGKWLTNTTQMYSDQLAKIGITVGSDSKLNLDTSVTEKASLTDIKSVFGTGTNNYSNKVMYKAEQIYSLAMTGGQSADSYTSSGAYNRDYRNSTNLFNSMI